MKKCGWLALVFFALNAVGCTTASFVQTDTFRPGDPKRLEWYIDKQPKLPYRAVGIIEVSFPAGTDLMTVVKAAYAKGQQVGCHLIIDRSLHVISPSADLTTSRTSICHPTVNSAVCQYRTQPQPVYGGSAPDALKREFVCGVYSSR